MNCIIVLFSLMVSWPRAAEQCYTFQFKWHRGPRRDGHLFSDTSLKIAGNYCSADLQMLPITGAKRAVHINHFLLVDTVAGRIDSRLIIWLIADTSAVTFLPLFLISSAVNRSIMPIIFILFSLLTIFKLYLALKSLFALHFWSKFKASASLHPVFYS